MGLTYTVNQIQYEILVGKEIYREGALIGKLYDCSESPGSGSPYSANFKLDEFSLDGPSYRLYGDTIEGLLKEMEEFRQDRVAVRVSPPPRAISKDLQEIQKQTTIAHARIAEKLEGIAEDCKIILRDLKEIEGAK